MIPASADALWDRMRALADTGHLRANELREAALSLESATAGFYAEPQTVPVESFVGSWARARRLWCDCSGEPLI